MASPSQSLILAGDTGGTNTRLAAFAVGEPLTTPVFLKKYESDTASSLDELVVRFCEEHAILPGSLLAAAFAIAGPSIIGSKSPTCHGSFPATRLAVR